MFVLTNTPRKFTPTKYKDSENPLSFTIIPPTRKVNLKMQELILRSVNNTPNVSEESLNIEGVNLPIADLMDLYLEDCVVDWENVFDENKQPIKFSKEMFNYFNDSEVIVELYNEIKELAESTEKN